jgi:2,3,4,5-tetrahydropyridine-2-carboxylate N-succinyltransferase
MPLQTDIESLFDNKPDSYIEDHFRLFQEFKDALNAGRIRSAERDASANTGWRVNAWVKKGILLGFRMGGIVDMSIDSHRQPWMDKATYPIRRMDASAGIRIVPGGSSIRDGCYIGKGVTCMPPVLEPVGALPVILEDEVLAGGNTGVYEGTVVKRRAVLGTGVILNRSTPVYDIVRGEVYSATDERPLVIPAEAVVIAGSRAISQGKGKEWGLSLYTPVIVKYRDARTDTKLQLEDLLR